MLRMQPSGASIVTQTRSASPFVSAAQAGADQPTREATSTRTPGPMVELSAARFR